MGVVEEIIRVGVMQSEFESVALEQAYLCMN